jgi:hypothetical protein
MHSDDLFNCMLVLLAERLEKHVIFAQRASVLVHPR